MFHRGDGSWSLEWDYSRQKYESYFWLVGRWVCDANQVIGLPTVVLHKSQLLSDPYSIQKLWRLAIYLYPLISVSQSRWEEDPSPFGTKLFMCQNTSWKGIHRAGNRGKKLWTSKINLFQKGMTMSKIREIFLISGACTGTVEHSVEGKTNILIYINNLILSVQRKQHNTTNRLRILTMAGLICNWKYCTLL